MTDNITKDFWDKSSAVGGLIGIVLIPVVVAIVGNAFASAIKEGENRVKYTELAISISASISSGIGDSKVMNSPV